MRSLAHRLRRTAASPERGRRRSRVLTALVALALAGCERAGTVAASRDDALARLDSMALVFVPGPIGSDDRSYWIDRFEVTNAAFAEFEAATHYRPVEDAGFLLQWGGAPRPADERLMNHPVTFVSRTDAFAFASWRKAELPTADEWERVAREVLGGQGEALSRFYMNARETGIGGTARVGTFESGRTRSPNVSPSVYDLLGNVREWTATDVGEDGRAVTKGGSFADPVRNIRPDAVTLEEADNRNHALGFRLVVRDAARIVRDALDKMATLDPAPRARALDRFAEFGVPLARLVKRMRLNEAITARVTTDDSESDVCVPLADGRVLRLTREGDARLLDGDRQLAFISNLGECYHARAADLDGDGVEEVYAAAEVAADVAPDTIDDRIVETMQDGTVTMRDAATGAPLTWANIDGSLAADFRDAFGPPPSAATSDTWWHVPRFRQTLRRIDVVSDALVVRWATIVPYSDVVLPIAARHQILVPAILWTGREADSVVARRILELHVVDPATGKSTRLGAVPGGAASLALLSSAPPTLLVVADTGHALVVTADGESLVARSVDRDPSHPSAMLAIGASPDGGTLSRSGSSTAGPSLEIVSFDATGRERAQRSLTAGTDAPLRMIRLSAPELGRGALVREGQGRIRRLDDRLADAWAADGLAHVDIGSVESIVAHAAGGGARIVVPLDFDGFASIDLATGAVLDRYAAPGTGLVKLIALNGGRGEIWVGYRDQGLYRVPLGPRTPASAAAAELLDRIDAAGTRP